MHLLAWLLIAAVLGWIASRVMQTDQPRNALVNAVVGFAGAALSGWLLASATFHSSEFTLAGMFVSFMGAIALLAVADLIRRVRAR